MKQAHLDLIILFLSETIATGLLIFLGCMGCVETEHVKPNHLTITLGFGLAVMIVLMIFGMVSGAHLNPAVTLTAYVYKRVTLQVICWKTGKSCNFNSLFIITGSIRILHWSGAWWLSGLRTFENAHSTRTQLLYVLAKWRDQHCRCLWSRIYDHGCSHSRLLWCLGST